MYELMPFMLFLSLFILLMFGFPVAFTLGGVSFIFGIATFGLNFFNLLPLRIWGVMTNYVLIAVPLFIFMGVMLEKSGLAEQLLETMALLFGRIRGGLAISVIVVGAMLAASTGIVGATVVTMGLLSLPTMLKRGYNPKVATGTIAASGTLGQIIPPSIVLVLLGSVLNISVGDLFMAAVIPGFILVVLYLAWIFILAKVKPEFAPSMPAEELEQFKGIKMVKKNSNSLSITLFTHFGSAWVHFCRYCLSHRSSGCWCFGSDRVDHSAGKIQDKHPEICHVRDNAPYVHGFYYPGRRDCFWTGL